MSKKANVKSGKGTGFILKDVYLKYIRPVTWPDTVRPLPVSYLSDSEPDEQVLIASRAHDIQQSKSSFKLKHAIWSLKDKRLAAIGDR
jgi:acyl-CoA thioesterase FadM